MTDTPDTSPEAVERLAAHLELQSNPTFTKEKSAATLRALSAELDELKKEYDEFINSVQVRERVFAAGMGKLEARAEAAEAELDQRKADNKRWRQAATRRTNELITERDDQKKARIEAVRSWVNAEARAEEAEAARDALKAELAKAVEVLRKSKTAIDELISYDLGTLDYKAISNLVHKSRAFLARHQKETDT